ncbi:hypothetical protein GCM10022380_06520 [Amycolatopsis tucumanensis]|uniref:Uncharacterized protein n=1 Tax=Amycolatopsis tucumanensis TaxID=401106 RepID=A0ABP7HK90_9PSEU
MTWPDDTDLAYVGIPFAANHVRAFTEEFGRASLLQDAHLDSYRILRYGPPSNYAQVAGTGTLQ